MNPTLFSKITLTQDATIQEAAIHLAKNDLRLGGEVVLYIIDEQNKLIGSVMDIDIRKALIRSNISPQEKVTSIMHPSPKKIVQGEEVDSAVFKSWKRFQHIPIVDASNTLLGFKENQDIYSYPNKVIIMAGGLGTRLRPLTNDTPKPMLRLYGKPILQEIIEGFKDKGFIDFLISVNYKSDIIKNYFGDGKSFGVKIAYLEETQELGTCGSIKLAQDGLNEPFFLINGDVLANIDYELLLRTHKANQNQITICTFPYTQTIPYGVLETDGASQVLSITEKPQYTHQINCGVYIIDPKLTSLIEDNQSLDMPTLIQRALGQNLKVGNFPIEEWIDIGTLEDFYRAQNRFNLLKE